MASHQHSDARETITTQDGDGEGDHSARNDENPPGTASTNLGSIEILKIGNHVCPEEYANNFTPMEFEEVRRRRRTMSPGWDAVRQFRGIQHSLYCESGTAHDVWAAHACKPARVPDYIENRGWITNSRSYVFKSFKNQRRVPERSRTIIA